MFVVGGNTCIGTVLNLQCNNAACKFNKNASRVYRDLIFILYANVKIYEVKISTDH